MKNIFISHSSKDRPFIKKLKKYFSNRKYHVWISFENIRPNKYSADKISKKLKECDFIIFVLTKNALKSAYVNQEVGFAIALNENNVIPVIDYDKDILPGFLVGKDAVKLYKNSPKGTFLSISPYLNNDDLYKKHPYRETKNKRALTLTRTGYEMWIKILGEMQKGPTPISAFVGSYDAYISRDKQNRAMIDDRLKTFHDFFVETKFVEPVDLEKEKDHVYSYLDLKNWRDNIRMPVLYKITDEGRNLLEKWRKLKIEEGDTFVLTIGTSQKILKDK